MLVGGDPAPTMFRSVIYHPDRRADLVCIWWVRLAVGGGNRQWVAEKWCLSPVPPIRSLPDFTSRLLPVFHTCAPPPTLLRSSRIRGCNVRS
jgi:hypothetical protein